jgi:hypothetical protein
VVQLVTHLVHLPYVSKVAAIQLVFAGSVILELLVVSVLKVVKVVYLSVLLVTQCTVALLLQVSVATERTYQTIVVSYVTTALVCGSVAPMAAM